MLRRIVTALGVASLLVAVTTGTAAAATGKKTPGNPPAGSVCAEANGTMACFQKKGDRFWVKDTKKDGHWSRVTWDLVDRNRPTRCDNKIGPGQGWVTCAWPKDIPENKRVFFAAETMSGKNVWRNSLEVFSPAS